MLNFTCFKSFSTDYVPSVRECLQKFPLGPKLMMVDVFQPDCMEIYKASGKDKHINTIAQKTGIDVKVGCNDSV